MLKSRFLCCNGVGMYRTLQICTQVHRWLASPSSSRPWIGQFIPLRSMTSFFKPPVWDTRLCFDWNNTIGWVNNVIWVWISRIWTFKRDIFTWQLLNLIIQTNLTINLSREKGEQPFPLGYTTTQHSHRPTQAIHVCSPHSVCVCLCSHIHMCVCMVDSGLAWRVSE